MRVHLTVNQLIRIALVLTALAVVLYTLGAPEYTGG